MEESEDEMEDNERAETTVEEEEEEDEIIESDIELEGETVEPDNDATQKVLLKSFSLLNLWKVKANSAVDYVIFW